MTWTDERVELLKKLWADGLSASRIAAELGGVSRNSVIGKVHRLGLSGRAKSTSTGAPRPRKARSPSVAISHAPSPRSKARSTRAKVGIKCEVTVAPVSPRGDFGAAKMKCAASPGGTFTIFYFHPACCQHEKSERCKSFRSMSST